VSNEGQPGGTTGVLFRAIVRRQKSIAADS
jgi:hypothetical protein